MIYVHRGKPKYLEKNLFHCHFDHHMESTPGLRLSRLSRLSDYPDYYSFSSYRAGDTHTRTHTHTHTQSHIKKYSVDVV
jgi:hypothetical protein